jgi:hypothetical protein
MTGDRRFRGHDDPVRAALRDIYAPPTDPAYWHALEARILARARQGAADSTEWWQLMGAWARAGVLAAGVAAAVAGAALVQTRAAEARLAYEAVVEGTPALPLTATARGAAPAEEREATLRYVISH